MAVILRTALADAPPSSWVFYGADGKLQYQATAAGDTIPDFSGAGYMGGTQNIPLVPVVLTLNPSPTPTDDTARIQAAINQVSAMPLVNGVRGTILFTAGTYDISSTLNINASGVVLRGQGQGPTGTLFYSTGTTMYNVIEAEPTGSDSFHAVSGTTSTIVDSYVPVGATSFSVSSADISTYHVGDQIVVNRPSTQAWITAIGMDATGLGTEAWSPNSSFIQADRTITAINGDKITVNLPITTSLDSTNGDAYGGGTIFKYTTSRISNVGVENIRFDTVFASTSDNNHANRPIEFDGVSNSWIRNTTTLHYYNGPYFGAYSEFDTMQDNVFLDAVGDAHTGGFALGGQTAVIQRNYTDNTHAPFVTQDSHTVGPSAFVFDTAKDSLQSVGPHQRWASGVLWDNIKVTNASSGSGGIELVNRGNFGSGQGWAGANMVTWNTNSPWIDVESPPTAQNWAIGAISPDRRVDFTGPEGIYDSFGTPVSPNSLYIAQLKQSLGTQPTATATHQFSVGPNTNFTGPSVMPYIDPDWQALVQSSDMPGSGSVVGFDNSTLNARRAATILYSLKPQEKVVSGTLTLKVEALANLTTNDSFFLGSAGMELDFDMMGQLPWSKNQIRTITLDLSDIYGPLLGPLQNDSLTAGKFNLFWNGNVSIDSAQLTLGTIGFTSGVSRTWNGAGANANWTTGANWGGTAPAAGDSLVFDGTLGLVNTNNLAANSLITGLAFQSTAGAFVISGNAITMGGDITDQSTALQTINFGLALDTTHTVNVTGGGTLVLGGVVSGNGAGLTKTGLGTLKLIAANAYSGPTTVNGGTLILDFAPVAPSSILSSSSTVALGGGALAVNGAAAGSIQTVSSLTLNAGASALSVTSNGSATSLNLGAITRAVGGAVNFTLPTAGSITTTTANANFSGGQQSIIGGYATVAGATWAVSASDGNTPGAITGLANYVTNVFTAGKDVDLTSSQTSASTLTINSLRLSGNSSGQTVTLSNPLTVATGGILVTNPNDETLSGSSITSGNGQDVIFQIKNSDHNLTLSSQITGSVGLTLIGGPDSGGIPNRGRLKLENSTNNFVGNITIASGRLQLDAAALGDPSNSIVIMGGLNGGGQLFDNNVAIAATHQILISGLGFAEGSTSGSYGAIRVRNTISSPILLTGDARIGTSNSGILAGPISGDNELSLAADSGQTLTLSSAANDWTGGTRIERGKIVLGVDNALPTDTLLTFGSTIAPVGPWSPRGSATPTLELNGHNLQLGGFTIQSPLDTGYSGTPTITNTGNTADLLTINNTADFNFAGTITNGANSLSVMKLGAGTQTISGTNSYTGTTTINGGALVIGAAGALPTGGAVVNNAAFNVDANTSAGSVSGTGTTTVAGGVILNASSFAQGKLTMQLAGAAASANAKLNVSGTLTLAGSSLEVVAIGGFTPLLGNSFDLLDWGSRSGFFSSVELPALGNSLAWNTTRLYTAGILSVIDSNYLPGDFNRDGEVNAADVLVMEQALTNLPGYQTAKDLTNAQLLAIGDVNGDGKVNNADLQALQSFLESGGGSTDTVPEPAGAVLLSLGTLALLFQRRTRARSFPVQ
ncbi:MAG TPA: autotransporter-associated beta strand repeat-containing protein [Pirellulales bacterium]|nr:autotransporter-associated beta strand repeat-containing protein [Pirellulales bacterium]